MDTTKPFIIPKQLIVEAYKRVKANAGSGGVDEQSLEDFERNLKDNLYKIWNRRKWSPFARQFLGGMRDIIWVVKNPLF